VRHLLDVWIGAGKTSRRRADLTEVSVQTPGHGIDEVDHVSAVTRQRLLDRAVFEQRRDHRILRGEWLQFPVARRIGQRNAEPVQGPRQLLL